MEPEKFGAPNIVAFFSDKSRLKRSMDEIQKIDPWL
jgi:hypothetical protein